jgi:hypothetical protein
LTHFADQLDSERLQKTKDDAGVAHLQSEAPAQSIAWRGPTRLKTERDTIGTLVTELDVSGVRERWLLDTGANMSVVNQSFAKRLGHDARISHRTHEDAFLMLSSSTFSTIQISDSRLVLTGVSGNSSSQTGFGALTYTTSPPIGLGVGLGGDSRHRMIAIQFC